MCVSRCLSCIGAQRRRGERDGAAGVLWMIWGADVGLPAEPTGRRQQGDTDAMCWHVPSGGFGVVVILLFSRRPPARHTPIIQMRRFKVL